MIVIGETPRPTQNSIFARRLFTAVELQPSPVKRATLKRQAHTHMRNSIQLRSLGLYAEFPLTPNDRRLTAPSYSWKPRAAPLKQARRHMTVLSAFVPPPGFA